MVQIAPSILAADFAHLEQSCRRVLLPDNQLLHIDVMDGVFVPNISIGVPVLQSLASALPEAFYDTHLMIIRPQQYIEVFAKAGANGITIHYEAESPVVETLRQIRSMGLRAGLSIRPATPVEEIFPLLEELDMVLVMSVEPGFGGQAFMPEATGRIAALRAEAERRGLPLLLQVDGGINEQTAPLCVQAGVDILVAGSFVFGAQDPAATMRRLRGEIG